MCVCECVHVCMCVHAFHEFRHRACFDSRVCLTNNKSRIGNVEMIHVTFACYFVYLYSLLSAIGTGSGKCIIAVWNLNLVIKSTRNGVFCIDL